MTTAGSLRIQAVEAEQRARMAQHRAEEPDDTDPFYSLHLAAQLWTSSGVLWRLALERGCLDETVVRRLQESAFRYAATCLDRMADVVAAEEDAKQSN